MVFSSSSRTVVIKHPIELRTVNYWAIIMGRLKPTARLNDGLPTLWILFNENRNKAIITDSIRSSSGIVVNHLIRNSKYSIKYNTDWFQLSWVLLIFGTTAEYVIFSRFLSGLVGGAAQTCTALYFAEIANDNIRGRLSTSYAISRNFGILLVYVLEIYINYIRMSMICLVFCAFFAVSYYGLPSTPKYLLQIGADDVRIISLEAKKIICF